MEKSLVKKLIKDCVLKTNHNANVYLFGSKATNKEHSESDWDLLILLDNEHVSFSDEQKIRHSLYDVELEIEEPISTFVYSKKDWKSKMSATALFKNIQDEGILL